MTTIVSLPAPRQGRPASSGQEKGATILFFTGVRYVRDVAPDPDRTTEALEAPVCDRDGSPEQGARAVV